MLWHYIQWSANLKARVLQINSKTKEVKAEEYSDLMIANSLSAQTSNLVAFA